jgi:two-component sensor histidine kinase
LTVTENGVGFPAGLDFRETASLGLQIVTTLVDQLDGTIERQPHEGTAFKIEFMPEQRQHSTSNETISSG